MRRYLEELLLALCFQLAGYIGGQCHPFIITKEEQTKQLFHNHQTIKLFNNRHKPKTISDQIYISEVTTPAWRMTLNSGISSFVTLGMVIVFTLGKVRFFKDD